MGQGRLLVLAELKAATLLLLAGLQLTVALGDEAYMNQFAVHLKNSENADALALKHGFTNLGKIGSLDGYYLFEHHRVSKRSVDPSHEHHYMLNEDPEVNWVQQQKEIKRVKRDLFQGFQGFPTSSLIRNAPTTSFPDPLYGDQWYLHGGAAGGFDMNVVAAWQKGYSGKNVVVSILDDGIQSNHPDLIENYDPFASTDINGNDEDPMPQDNGDNKHGTRCAGEVAATAYNGICGVGVAFNASIGGVRMLDGTVNDAVEARALSHNPNHVDIYSASWGPEDDGKTVDGPGPLAMQAFIEGVRKGRRGKGSIFVWASGNGGRHMDNCNCDGYTNSIYTLSISSATQHGLKPWYLEECSSTLATTYSSGDPGHDRSVVTVDMDMSFSSQRMCTKEHTGTSASAPIAAAICALALEANRDLTWRDMQYLVVLSSKPEPLLKEDGWIMNGVGRKVSHKFGYGVIDAGAMVTLAERWATVPPQRICDLPPDSMERVIPNDPGSSAEFYLDTDGCFGSLKQVNFLEHVQARISLNFSPRGNLKIILTSPFGTRSTLLFPRPRDVFKANFEDWPFLSVHFWGERPAGRWRLSVMNAGNKPSHQPGVLRRWSLVFFGTEIDPVRKPSMESSDFLPFASASSPTLSSVPLIINGSRVDVVKSVDHMLDHSKCHAECEGGCFGDGPNRCKSCRYLSLETQSGRTCVRECPDGWYATLDLKCLQCHSSCSSCTGGSFGDCLACSSNLWLLRVKESTKCVIDCPVGFLRGDYQECRPCSPQCKSCYLNPDKCNDCHEGLIAFNGSCVQSCPQGTFLGEGNLQCLFCNPTCKSCDGRRCFQCNVGWYLQASSGLCQPSANNECSRGYFPLDGTCRPCHVSCGTCYGPAYSQCKACRNNRYLLKGVCVDKCPKGFSGKRGAECTVCHENCATCNGYEANECLSCPQGAELENGECRAQCPHGFFLNTAEGKCNACHATCSRCKGPGAQGCLSCPGQRAVTENECATSICPSRQYLAESQCLPCHETCETCTGSGVSDCKTCPDNRVLSRGSCAACSRGQFFDPLSQTCLDCDKNCTTCDGPDSFSCLSCKSPLRLEPVLRRCIPCCAQTSTDNCCDCSIHSESCVSNPTTDKRRIVDDNSRLSEQFKSTDYTDNSLTLEAVVLVVIALIAFAIVIFGAFKAHSTFSKWCNRDGYQRVPTQPAEKIKLIEEECDEENPSLHTNT